MNRYKAAAIHFLGSACILFLIFALVRWVWYPGPLFFAANGANLLGIITAVDVVLGPLIMLIIFVPGKKNLKLDIALVLICQIAFMLYGSWSIFEARPVYIAYAEQRFHLITANQIEEADLKKVSNNEFKRLPWLGPVVVGTKGPTEQAKRDEILFANLGGMGLQNLPQYYVPYAEAVSEIKRDARTLAEMQKLTPEERKLLADYQSQHKNSEPRFIPVQAKAKRLFAVIDPTTGKVLEWL